MDELQSLLKENKQRFYCCGVHVAHEFCLLCCNVQKSPVYKAFSYFALKIIPDFCETCQVPFLKEWMRESKL